MPEPNSTPNPSASTSGNPSYLWAVGEWQHPPTGGIVNWSSPIILTDVKTGELVVVARGQKGLIQIPLGQGKLAWRAAVRARFIGNEGGYAIARLADGRRIHVEILVGWQFAEDGLIPKADYTPSTRDPASDAHRGAA